MVPRLLLVATAQAGVRPVGLRGHVSPDAKWSGGVRVVRRSRDPRLPDTVRPDRTCHERGLTYWVPGLAGGGTSRAYPDCQLTSALSGHLAWSPPGRHSASPPQRVA